MIRQYPDPDSVVYVSTSPPEYVCRLTLRTFSRHYPLHSHSARMNGWGNGITDADSGHHHEIRGGRVLPCPVDGHTHGLTNLPCGAG